MTTQERLRLDIITAHYKNMLGDGYTIDALNQVFAKIISDPEVFSPYLDSEKAMNEAQVKERFNGYLQQAEPRQ
jgi:hypothetical protein